MPLQNSLKKILALECTIEVFGLGYVGFPLSVRLALSGFKVRGIDTNSKKIENLKNKLLTGSHLKLKTEFFEVLKKERLVLDEKPSKSDQPKVAVICVPTPIDPQDSNSVVKNAVQSFLDSSKAGDVIILESSVMVGTTNKIKQIIESKGYEVGKDFGLCFCPERIDPLNRKWKLENIPRIIFASDDTTFRISQKIYDHVNNAHLKRVSSPEIAEVVKSFENAFRLVNISLVNELAVLCDKLKINVKDVINAASTKPFGFMPFYSGAGAGGHCIPKDPQFLLESAKKMNASFSSIENAVIINSQIPKYIVDSIEKTLESLKQEKSVIVCGLSYKPDIEDMRDSPGFKILNELYQENFKVASYDPYFKSELLEEYLVENHIKKLDFTPLSVLDEKSITGYSCLCIVQHHVNTAFRIGEIYKKSLVPLIYDCQNKIRYNPDSKTIVKRFGS